MRWQSVEAYASGKVHTFRIKEMKPILWRKAEADLPVRIVDFGDFVIHTAKNTKFQESEVPLESVAIFA